MLYATASADVGGIDVDQAVRQMYNESHHYNHYHHSHKDADNRLPQIGTPGSDVITVQEERVFGKFYFRTARQNLKVINDPVLDDYIKDLGNRLIAHANQVYFPFNFFLTQDRTINASAFLGGNVRVHTGLVSFTENESQLAAVLAHEITHVTQRHIARFLEDAARRQTMTIGAMVGGVILAIINPALGMAALQTTLGLNMQAEINYTRQDELEADHIGIDLLYRAGFDPTQMAELFRRMSKGSQRNIPQGLLTHPIPETRVADARSRADRLRAKAPAPQINYYFAKARIKVRHSDLRPDEVIDYYQKATQSNSTNMIQAADYYGLALGYLADKSPSRALRALQQIPKNYQNNLFVVDALTDIYLLLKQPQTALALLDKKYELSPYNQTIAINYAVALNAAGQYKKAVKVLKKYLVRYPENIICYDLLAQNYQKLNMQYEYYVALAQKLALFGEFDQSNAQLNRAAKHAKSRLEKARLDALVVRNEETRLSDKQFKN